jgi:hypothetical protein
MKPTTCLIAITGVAAVVFLGYSVGRVALGDCDKITELSRQGFFEYSHDLGVGLL